MRAECEVGLRLLCGADLLESFAVPGLWASEHVPARRSAFNSNCSARVLSERRRFCALLGARSSSRSRATSASCASRATRTTRCASSTSTTSSTATRCARPRPRPRPRPPSGCSPLNSSRLCSGAQFNIHIVRDFVVNEISATKIRCARVLAARLTRT